MIRSKESISMYSGASMTAVYFYIFFEGEWMSSFSKFCVKLRGGQGNWSQKMEYGKSIPNPRHHWQFSQI